MPGYPFVEKCGVLEVDRVLNADGVGAGLPGVRNAEPGVLGSDCDFYVGVGGGGCGEK